jgi:hypothetical protein
MWMSLPPLKKAKEEGEHNWQNLLNWLTFEG